MENKRQQLMILVAVISILNGVTCTQTNQPCRGLAENDICGLAGPMTKRCRKVDQNCAGVNCHLVCVPEYRGNPATIDLCSPNPCLHGTCTNQQGAYTCQCELSWSGVNCDVPDCSASSPLYCNCIVECPNAVDEAICDCSGSDYSDDWVTIHGAVIGGFTVDSVGNSDPDQCKAFCVTTPGCKTAEFDTATGICWLNSVTAFQIPYSSSANYDFYFRTCVCN